VIAGIEAAATTKGEHMAGFLYFLPGCDEARLVKNRRVDHAVLSEYGLAHVLADCLESPNHLIVTKSTGPNNESGVAIVPHPGHTDGKIPLVPIVHPGSQTWRMVASDIGRWTVWIGFQTDSPPEVEDFARRDQVDGYRWTDQFGRSWQIPVIRGRESQYGYLPCDYVWHDSTEPVLTLRSGFDQLWQDSARVWDHLYSEDYRAVERFLASFVARVFAVNYRIGPLELETLRKLNRPAFDRSLVSTICAFACDYPAVKAWADQKKMSLSQAAVAGTCSTAGLPAETENSVPVVAN
jgi:hypothetical protein